MKIIPNGTQTVARVLQQIALTSIEPNHAEKLHGSCHWKTAMVIHENIGKELLPSDEVVLVGINSRVFHSFLIRDGEVIYDSDKGVYNHQQRTYNAENWKNAQFDEDIYVMAQEKVGDLREAMAKRMGVTLPASTSSAQLTPQKPKP